MTTPAVVVAGHICLDIIPAIPPTDTDLAALLSPGKLVDVGPAVVATGGAVANTGLALHRLGAPVKLAALVGDDTFGHAVRAALERFGPGLSDHLVVGPDVATSYTVVVNVPGIDRVFLHCPGANDAFDADTPPPALFDHAFWFHFGYPPLMRKMFEDGGAELERLLAAVRRRGPGISLDLARPDPESPAGRVDWPRLLERVLPFVDVFFPSFDEITWMLDGAVAAEPTIPGLRSVADRLLAMGAGAVCLKLGDRGAYLRTGPGPRHPAFARDAAAWTDRELYHPCFRVSVAGATGAGDCTIAGFLYGLTRGFSPSACLRAATATGACNVEHPDATSGILPWEAVERRLAAGWPRHPVSDAFAEWEKDADGAWRPASAR